MEEQPLAKAGQPDRIGSTPWEKSFVAGDNCWVEVWPISGNKVEVVANISLSRDRWLDEVAESDRRKEGNPSDHNTPIRAAVVGIEARLIKQLGKCDSKGAGYSHFGRVNTLRFTFTHRMSADPQTLADQVLAQMKQGIAGRATFVDKARRTPESDDIML